MFLPSNITLKFGDSGDFVAELQRRLATARSYPEDQINGFYDGTTVNGVASFQTRCGIRADGIAGPETLRRLNAAITGTASSEDNKTGSTSSEEEAKAAAAAQLARTHYLMDQQAMQGQPPLMSPQEAPVYGNEAHGHGGMGEQQAMQQQFMREQMAQPSAEQLMQQQLQQQQQMQVQQQLAQQQQLMQQQAMLMQQQPPQPQLLAETPAMPPQAQHAPQPQPQFGQQAPQAQFGQQAQPPAAGQAHTAAAPTPEQPKSLMGRVMEKMDAMMQKLASYFEAKLPPDTLREVKQLGAIMAASGVKENPIPTGPEPDRTQQLPARGPEQAQSMQRG